MSKKEKKKYTSTYEQLIHENPDFKKDLEKRYKKLILSELITAIMQEDHSSVRRLAKAAKVSPSCANATFLKAISKTC